MKTEAEVLKALEKLDDIYTYQALQKNLDYCNSCWNLKKALEWCLGIEPATEHINELLKSVPDLASDSPEREYLEAAKKLMRSAATSAN